MALEATGCPFKAGETVYYCPSYEGYAKTLMHSPRGQPELGQGVTITAILKGQYVAWEGGSDALYWTEFTAQAPSPDYVPRFLAGLQPG